MHDSSHSTESTMDDFASLTGNVFLQIDAGGTIRYISENYRDILGVTKDIQPPCSWHGFLADDSRPLWESTFEKAKQAPSNHQCSLQLAFPSLPPSAYFATVRFCPKNQTALLALRRHADVEDKFPVTLQKALDRLNLSLQTARLGVWEMELKREDAESISISWDHEMCRMHGVPSGTVVNFRTWFKDHVHPDDLQGLLQRHKQHLAGDETELLHVKYRTCWPNGEIHFIEMHGTMSRTKQTDKPDVIFMYGVAKDITSEVLEKKRLEDQKNVILANSRMTVLGEISGGIAHEINNPLTIIQARSFQLSTMVEQNSLDPLKVKSIAESISKTGDKIAKIVKSIRAFSQSQENSPFDSVSIEELIDETLDFCKVRFYNHGIQIRVAPLPEDLEIECRLVQIEEVLLNLFNNAHDAILKLSEKWIAVEAFDNGTTVDIHITDAGTGIPEAVADQMMQPFFTTKESGKGTGLGLSIAAEIVQSHHGQLRLDRTSANTRFVITLPKHQPEPPTNTSARP